MALLERLPVGPDTVQWPLWSTTARVVVTGASSSTASPGSADVDEARRITERVCAEVDAACSRFRPDAEIHRLYRAAGRPITVSPVLAELLATALEAARRTDGDVDPTVASAMRALGYDRDLDVAGSDHSTIPVCGSSIRLVARPVGGWRRVDLDGRRLRVPPGISLDLGATAKAWAADRAAQLVAEKLGAGSGVMVSLGGDIATAGVAPQGDWPVLVCDGPGQPESWVTLPAGTALATSSTISRTWRRGGQSMHHVLDPRTSLPAPTVWRTVSVAAPTCVEANTCSTASIVRGHDAVRWLRMQGATARLVTAHGDVVPVGAWPMDVAA
jgi:FAD:protein FMN transferase